MIKTDVAERSVSLKLHEQRRQGVEDNYLVFGQSSALCAFIGQQFRNRAVRFHRQLVLRSPLLLTRLASP